MLRLLQLHKTILFGLAFCSLVLYAQAQSSILPYKVTIFKDAAQVGYKGIVQFHGQKAELPILLNPVATTIDLVSTTADAKVSYFKVRDDSVSKSLQVGNWAELLQANMGKRMTIVYYAGMELDEVSGDVKWVNAQDKLLLLHTSDESDYYIPLNQITQIIVRGPSSQVGSQKVPQRMLEVGINKDVPFVPLEMFAVHKGIYWTPICRLRILGPDKALLQLAGVIENDMGDLNEVEVELSASEILRPGRQNGDALNAGKLVLKKGDRVALNLKEVELQYAAAYNCRIPWTGALNDGTQHHYPVENLLRFEVPALPELGCDQYIVIDENNRQIANITLKESATNGPVQLELGEEKMVKVSVVENEIKRGKTEKIGEQTFVHTTIEAKITCFNVGQKFIQLQLQRDIKGTIVENDKAKVEENPDEPGVTSLAWKQSLDKGQKKEVTFKYEALVPLKSK